MWRVPQYVLPNSESLKHFRSTSNQKNKSQYIKEVKELISSTETELSKLKEIINAPES